MSATPDQPAGHCTVYGCPRAGHIRVTSWNCRYHYNRPGSRLDHITLMLRNHADEINWYERLLLTRSYEFGADEMLQHAPYGLAAKAGESFVAYRDRIAAHVESLMVGG